MPKLYSQMCQSAHHLPQGEFIPPISWVLPARFCLVEALEYDICTVPAGFITDGLSLSRWVGALGVLMMFAAMHTHVSLLLIGAALALAPIIFPRWGNTLRACILHDYLLQQHNISWHWANLQFFRWLRVTNNPLWQCVFIFCVVSVYQAARHVFKRSTN